MSDVVVGEKTTSHCDQDDVCVDIHLSDLSPEAQTVLQLAIEWFDANADKRFDALFAIEQRQGKALYDFAASVRRNKT